MPEGLDFGMRIVGRRYGLVMKPEAKGTYSTPSKILIICSNKKDDKQQNYAEGFSDKLPYLVRIEKFTNEVHKNTYHEYGQKYVQHD